MDFQYKGSGKKADRSERSKTRLGLYGNLEEINPLEEIDTFSPPENPPAKKLFDS